VFIIGAVRCVVDLNGCSDIYLMRNCCQTAIQIFGDTIFNHLFR
jgi:hypothetical protein